jgi:hypothetical protein
MVEQHCGDAIDWMIRQMSRTDLLVMRTFDLHAARNADANCPCPHHGTTDCDCQMVVLLVYAGGRTTSSEQRPVSIVAHGYNGQTWFSMVDTPQQRADQHLEAAIRQALLPQNCLA